MLNNIRPVLSYLTHISTIFLTLTSWSKTLSTTNAHKQTNTIYHSIIYLMYKLHCPHNGTLAPGVKFCGFSTPRPLLGAVRPAEAPALPVG